MSENLGQIGRRLREYLKEHRPRMYAELACSGHLDEYLVNQEALYEAVFERTQDQLKAQRPPPIDFLERVAYETQISRIAKEIAFDEAWPKSEEDQPALGENDSEELSSDELPPATPFRKPFYGFLVSSSKGAERRSLLDECFHRLAGAILHFVCCILFIAVLTFGLTTVAGLWRLFEILIRADWNIKIAKILVGLQSGWFSALLENAYAYFFVLGGFCGIVSAVGVLITGDSVVRDFLGDYHKLVRVLCALSRRVH